MDSLPDDVFQYIISNSIDIKDLASCNCVSKKWKHLITLRKSLHFPSGIFNNLTVQTTDSIVMHMITLVSQLEELIVSCPFTTTGLASWLFRVGSSLKNLDLRFGYASDSNETLTKLECIQAARNLESLRLSCVVLKHTPKWDVFEKLKNLEIVNATLEDSVLVELLSATPNLTHLQLCGCKGLEVVSIELLELRHCKLEFYQFSFCSLTLKAPKIEDLEVESCHSIRVYETDFLKNLSIGDDYGGKMYLFSV